MKESVRRNILSNGLANILSKTVRVAEQLLLVPFFLSAWGAAYYGEWLTLTIIPSVLAFAELGVGTSSCNAFVLSYSAGRFQESSAIYATGLRIVTFCVIIGIVLSTIIMIIAFQMGWLSKSLIKADDAIWTVVLLMSSRLVSFYNQLFEGFFRCKHKAHIAVNIKTVEGIVKVVAGILVLIILPHIVLFAFVQFLISIIANIFYGVWGCSLMKDLQRGKWNKSIAVDTIKKGLAYFMGPLWMSLYFQGTTFVVRLILGPEAVAVFNTLRTIARSVNQLFSTISSSVFPELQTAIGEGKWDVGQKLFRGVVWSSFMISIVGIVFLAIWGLPIYDWWTHQTMKVSNEMWYLFLIGILFNAVWWTAGVAYKTVNKPYRYVTYGIVCAIMSLAATYLLSQSIGIYGAILGYVMMDIMMFFLVYPYACKLMKLNWLMR